MQAVGLKTYIWNNNFKSLLLLCGFPVLLVGMVYALELMGMYWGVLPRGPYGESSFSYAGSMLAASAPLAIGAALVWFVIAYFSYQTIIDLSTGARAVTRTDEPEIYNLLENLAISRGMRTPTLRIVDTEAMNAFATGLHEGSYSVTVTTGLLQAMDRDELEAVLAHEMTHVINRDVRLMVIASIFAGVITLIAQVIFRSIWFVGPGRSRDRRGGAGLFMLAALAIAAIGYVLALFIKMAISRRREYIADMGSVELTKNPDAMISALMKISGNSEMHAPQSIRSMFLDDDDEGVMGLFATHPPISKRIDALVKFAGGRIPDAAPAPAPIAAQPSPSPQAIDSPPVGIPMPGQGPWGGSVEPVPTPVPTPGRRRSGPWG